MKSIDIFFAAASDILEKLPGEDPNTLLPNILNFVYFAVGIIAVGMIIYGGIMYSISGGDSNKLNQAKNIISYAIVGLIVVIMAFAITAFFTGIFQ